jgi:hypothetical protein
MNPTRRFLALPILACALLAALALAASASAEIRVGEAAAPLNPALEPEADIVGARAEYDSDTGTVTFKVTTAGAPSPGTIAEPSKLEMAAGLASPSTCNASVLGEAGYPSFSFTYQYLQPNFVIWALLESAGAEPKAENGTAGLAAIATSQTTTTFVATAPKVANLPFSCAVALVHIGFDVQGEPLVFPIAVPPPAPPADPGTAQNQTPTAPPAASKPAPAALSIAASKPLKLKAGKWKTVRIKVANTGDTATAPGSLRLKAPRGVLVKPARQKLPMLSAGGSWTLAAKVRLTGKAKRKSTVPVTATAGDLAATGSLVLKRRG